jgi:hypothetical protein
VNWSVDLHDDFVPEYCDLNKDVQDELLAHIELLEARPAARAAPRGYAERLTLPKHEGIEV